MVPAGSADIPYPEPRKAAKSKQMERRLRLALIVLGLVNTAFIAGSGLVLGLCSNEVSIGANLLIFCCAKTFGKPWIRLATDAVFAAGHMVWFVFANLSMSTAHMSSDGIVVGTWSSVVTLVMFFMTTALCVQDFHEVAQQIHQHATRSREPGSSTSGCAHCAHCQEARANESSALLTARDDTDPPAADFEQRASSAFANGFRQWAAKGHYAPLPSYEDCASEEGRIQLEPEADEGAVARQHGRDVKTTAPKRLPRDEEEGL